jgi:hypothetical protein
MAQQVKCACPSCHCTVEPDKAVVRDGKVYCSTACAYECTATTCVCVHDHCEEK